MNAPEFNQWWIDAKLCFPSMAGWLSKTFADPKTQNDFLRKWAAVLADVTIADALEVNRLMQSGDLPFVGEYDSDKERLPQHVRRHARRLAASRRPREVEPTSELSPSSFPAGKILRRIFELTGKGGLSSSEAKEIALKEFPIGKSKWEPRYQCRLCFDVGRIEVASNQGIRAMLAGTFDLCRGNHRNAVVACKCKAHQKRPENNPIAVYDASLCYRIDDPLWPDSQVDDFRAWCEAKREEFWNSKREPAFDAFNRKDVYA
jgi:hypothetical protein